MSDAARPGGDAPSDVEGQVDARPSMGWVLVTATVVVAADHATKWWAQRELASGAIDLGVVDLRLTYNYGAAFSLGGAVAPFLAVVAFVVVLWLIRSTELGAGRGVSVAAGAVVGGALGNLLDRGFRSGDGVLGGGVVDFIDLGWWPVFNIADIAVVCGGIALVLLGARTPSGESA